MSERRMRRFISVSVCVNYRLIHIQRRNKAMQLLYKCIKHRILIATSIVSNGAGNRSGETLSMLVTFALFALPMHYSIQSQHQRLPYLQQSKMQLRIRVRTFYCYDYGTWAPLWEGAAVVDIETGQWRQ